MTKVTIDLVKLIEQAVPQVFGSVELQLLEQWLGHNSGTERLVTIDLAVVPVENEARPAVPYLQPRINDIITFDDDSQLRIHVLAARGSGADLATDAYYGLLTAISNI